MKKTAKRLTLPREVLLDLGRQSRGDAEGWVWGGDGNGPQPPPPTSPKATCGAN